MATQKHKTKKQDERKMIVRAASKASTTAVRISNALELSVQKVKGEVIILQSADGSQKEIKKVQQVKSPIQLSKGTVLCLHPKK